MTHMNWINRAKDFANFLIFLRTRNKVFNRINDAYHNPFAIHESYVRSNIFNDKIFKDISLLKIL